MKTQDKFVPENAFYKTDKVDAMIHINFQKQERKWYLLEGSVAARWPAPFGKGLQQTYKPLVTGHLDSSFLPQSSPHHPFELQN